MTGLASVLLQCVGSLETPAPWKELKEPKGKGMVTVPVGSFVPGAPLFLARALLQ